MRTKSKPNQNRDLVNFKSNRKRTGKEPERFERYDNDPEDFLRFTDNPDESIAAQKKWREWNPKENKRFHVHYMNSVWGRNYRTKVNDLKYLAWRALNSNDLGILKPGRNYKTDSPFEKDGSLRK